MPQSLSSVMPVGSFGHDEATGLLTVTVTPADAAVLPAASRATPVSVWDPLPIVVVFHTIENGDAVSSGPRFAPSILNCTPATPTLSEASAVTATVVPDTVTAAAGAVTETVGGVASPAPG